MTKTVAISLASLQETIELGKRLGRTAAKGDVITLEGDLGTGKTTLTQAIGLGLEVPSSFYITSPTFTLLQEYPGRIPLYHMDLYRLGSEEEIEDLGFDEYLHGRSDGLAVVEWPDRMGSLMPENRLHITLDFSKKADTARSATLTAHGDNSLKYIQPNPFAS
jgi:tRNA threonylcarbamoyladenosine biosynthesis protein TsaE